MSTKLIEYFGLLLYSIVAAVIVVWFAVPMYVALAVLTVLPLAVFLYRERLKSRAVVWLAFGSFVFALALGVFAYVNGIWFETSASELRLFGLVPVEALFAAFMHIFYFIVMYEYFFDDRQTESVVKHRSVYLITMLSVFAFALSYVYLFSSIILTNAFAWLVLMTFALIGFGVILLYHNRVLLIKRLSLFALSVLPLSLLYEFVALANSYRFFANTNEYLYSLTVFGQALPLEELLFIAALPVAVALFYELFFDDEA